MSGISSIRCGSRSKDGDAELAPTSALAALGQDLPAEVDTSHLTLAALRREIRDVEESGFDATIFRVDLHQKLASPLACLVLPALGLLLATAGPPFWTPAQTLVLSALQAVGYLLLSGVATSLGYGRFVPPLVAGWGPIAAARGSRRIPGAALAESTRMSDETPAACQGETAPKYLSRFQFQGRGGGMRATGAESPGAARIAARTIEREMPAPSHVPSVWLLMGHRAGDNTQVHALGEALGWGFEEKRFVYKKYERVLNLPFMTTLAGVAQDRSSVLLPPWPDLVITAGRRNEPIARWIKAHSGGRTKLVHVGRPWARLDRWDLVVTTPQYRLPKGPTVVHNEAPLHRVTRERLADAALEWAPRVAQLPRPYVTVLAGGPSGPYPFDPSSGARLARQASELAGKRGGSLLVTTSARTPAATVDALFGGITVPAMSYRWRRDDADNPFFGFLALADAIIVTGDSVSMMTEACATGRPVYFYDTGEGKTSMRGTARADREAGSMVRSTSRSPTGISRPSSTG